MSAFLETNNFLFPIVVLTKQSCNINFKVQDHLCCKKLILLKEKYLEIANVDWNNGTGILFNMQIAHY